jgi:hypothetical protein
MNTTYKITGNDATRLAERENLRVSDQEGTPFVTVTPTGWRNSSGNHCDGEGRTVEGYFNGCTGEYLGPDDDGVEPCWNDASISDDAITAYLATLSADALADWATGRIDEVMADHAASYFGAQINGEITRVAATL